MTFIVGPDHTVHAKACRNTPEDGVLYITTAKNHSDLRAWLDRSDIKDRHIGPSLLTACEECIDFE